MLGSGTVAPTPHRNPAALWVETDTLRILMDCGPGCLRRAAEFDVAWWRADIVALTHFHPDHWGELPLLLMAMRYGIEPARTAPLTVLGPEGLRDRLEHLAGALGDWVVEPGYPLVLEEIGPAADRSLGGGVTLETCKTPHTPESVAFGLRAGDRRLVYTGDTGPSPDLAAWARGCDLLICECSLPDDRAVEIHLTPSQVGALARDARPARVVLTHLYPPVENPDPAEVVRKFFDGEVVVARDGGRYRV